MLQIKNIKKEYRTGTLIQKALDDVSLNLRDNEFVAILGPSGSGKSTLLNIIGGLDRYDSGDLIINNVSTKKYKDRDWDSYRNHTIGFIFQSYNLIPHQTVLANVELALTISGISKKERKEKAIEALKKVGLGEQMHKKPSQMSGGQMQRVAIARALVNNPSILLADEPTGALDTETSIQVMDLLKEVAKDRLVVMVTHNPELAEDYASRIVKLKDGKIISDSDPYELSLQEKGEIISKNLGKASMSFLTALSLSLNNLLTKKTRTVLVSFAGSIGIIGIGLIMSISNGMNTYIKDTEKETLSEYPLTIEKTAFDLSSAMVDNNPHTSINKEAGKVQEIDVVSGMLKEVSDNDLGSLKTYLDESDEISKYASAVEYNYSVKPLIYLEDGDTVHQVNPNKVMNSSGIMPTSSLYESMFSADVFHALPKSKQLYEQDYDVKAGRWPENNQEAVIVLDRSGTITDMELYLLGLKDYDELEKIINRNGEVSGSEEVASYEYDDFLDITLKRVNAADLYTYDEENALWTDRSLDLEYLKNTVANSEDMKIVGVVQLSEEATVSMLTSGIYYPYELTHHLISEAKDSPIVKAQLENPDINVLTSNTFDEDNSKKNFDFSKMFSVDGNAMQNAFSFDTSKINTDMSSAIDQGQLTSLMTSATSALLPSIQTSIQNNLKLDNAQTTVQTLLEEYLEYSSQKPETDYANIGKYFLEYLNQDSTKQLIQQGIKGILSSTDTVSQMSDQLTSLFTQIASGLSAYMEKNGYTDIQKASQSYFASKEVQDQITLGMSQILANVDISQGDIETFAQALLTDYQNYAKNNKAPDLQLLSTSIQEWLDSEEGKQALNTATNQVLDVSQLEEEISFSLTSQTNQVVSYITGSISNSLQSMMKQLPNAFSVNTDMMQSAFKMNFDETEIKSMFTSMMSSTTVSKDSNLKTFGYVDETQPSSISIYPKDFSSKENITNLLEDYNKQMEDLNQENKVITYTDMVGTLMSNVTTIVDTISYVLIAFVAISLVVSSIMIGVITYISVLERKKEIGILRAIGASKRNISEVFNAETFITGLLAGLMGVGISLLLLFPINAIIHSVAGNTAINAVMPVQGGIFLVILSVILTMIGGIIPSSKAAKSDPVAALRTD